MKYPLMRVFRVGYFCGKIRKFTLLELLLTMAVIAILAGVLLPVLNSSRMKAQAASCFSNLKQIGVAAAGYSQNFEDYWCPATSDVWNFDVNYENSWLVSLWPDLSSGKRFPTIDSGASKTSPAICPAAKREDLFFHSERPVTNLAWNERFGNGSRYGLRKATRCRVPSKAATLWDVSNIDSELNLSYTATRNSRDYNLPAVAKKWTSGRHAGGYDNILFVDGHAGSFDIARQVDHVSFLYSAFMPDSDDIGSPLWPQ